MIVRISFLICVVAFLGGCETVTDTVDAWFTQGPTGEDSQAERVTDSTAWLIPSPYRELAAAVVAGFAGFWTARKREASAAIKK